METSESEKEPIEIEYLASDSDVGERLDVVLLKAVREDISGRSPDREITRSQLHKWLSEGRVFLNAEVAGKPGYKIKSGDSLSVYVPEATADKLEPDSSVKLDIIFEDEHLLVLNKQAGVVVHPGAGNREGTLLQGLLSYLGDELLGVGDVLRPGIVHRLDKDTTGALVVAKTEKAYRNLHRQFLPPRTIHRTYLAMAVREPRGSKEVLSGIINFPIGRSLRDRKKMAVIESGRDACSRWRLLKPLSFGVHLEVELETGRTHQIRVHLAHTHAPILGDPVYGPSVGELPGEIRKLLSEFGRPALHARSVEFLHPHSGEKVYVEAPLSKDYRELLEALGGEEQ